MIDFNRGNYETAGARSDRHAVSSPPFSRRSFLVKTSRFGAFYAAAKLIPLPALAAELAGDTRVSRSSTKAGRPQLWDLPAVWDAHLVAAICGVCSAILPE
jgi:hypothetical protein